MDKIGSAKKLKIFRETLNNIEKYSIVFDIGFWRLNLRETNLYYNESFSNPKVFVICEVYWFPFCTECKLHSLGKSIFHFQTLSFYSNLYIFDSRKQSRRRYHGYNFLSRKDKELKSRLNLLFLFSSSPSFPFSSFFYFFYFSLFRETCGWPLPSGLRLDLQFHNCHNGPTH